MTLFLTKVSLSLIRNAGFLLHVYQLFFLQVNMNVSKLLTQGYIS